MTAIGFACFVLVFGYSNFFEVVTFEEPPWYVWAMIVLWLLIDIASAVTKGLDQGGE